MRFPWATRQSIGRIVALDAGLPVTVPDSGISLGHPYGRWMCRRHDIEIVIVELHCPGIILMQVRRQARPGGLVVRAQRCAAASVVFKVLLGRITATVFSLSGL